jgi:hypothetical protein
MKIPSRPTTPPGAKSRSAAPVDNARVLEAVGVERTVLLRVLADELPEGSLVTREVFTDADKLDDWVGRTEVEFNRVVNLMVLLAKLFDDEVVNDRTEVVELVFKVMTGVITWGMAVALKVGTWT